MNEQTIQLLAKKAQAKVALLNESKLKYIVSAMFAGLLVGMGCILVYSVGGMLHAEHSPFTTAILVNGECSACNIPPTE